MTQKTISKRVRNLSCLLIFSTLMLCGNSVFERDRGRDRECDNDRDEEQECYLNGEEIPCEYCNQDGGCRWPSATGRIKIKIVRLLTNIRIIIIGR